MKGRYGICPACKTYKYLNGTTCKTCTYQEGVCVACNRQAKIYVSGRCYLCYQDSRVLLKIKELESSFNPKTPYNGQLFELYLSYIKRYRLNYTHVKTTKKLLEVLQRDSISTIRSWFDTYLLSDQYCIYQKPEKLQGCVFIKIGKMLSELGVIPLRENEFDLQLSTALSYLATPNIKEFVSSLLQINIAPRTILNSLRFLRTLERFAADGFNIYSILELDKSQLLNFFDQQMETIKSQHGKRKLFLEIRRFYKWALLKNYIAINPVPNLKLSRPTGELVICSEQQFTQLKKYICCPDSDPEKALLLTLILFYGMTTIDLAQAKIIIHGDELSIRPGKRPLTRGKKYYRRKDILCLPNQPKWIVDLQKRFIESWEGHYLKVKKNFPNTPLVLPKSNISNRCLNTDTILLRIKEATIHATGKEIPIRVLRQTCGHLYSQKADCSILSTMGWSDQFAFHYTWLPRSYHS